MKDQYCDTRTVEWQGTTYRIAMRAEDTGGAMAMVESLTPPGEGPPRHIHHAEDEAFIVLSGELEFWLEGRTIFAGTGQAVFVPRGAEHTFRNCGALPCRHLVILTPGGFEGFFEEMAAGRFRVPEDMPAVIEAGARHNLTITGPPLGQA